MTETPGSMRRLFEHSFAFKAKHWRRKARHPHAGLFAQSSPHSIINDADEGFLFWSSPTFMIQRRSHLDHEDKARSLEWLARG